MHPHHSRSITCIIANVHRRRGRRGSSDKITTTKFWCVRCGVEKWNREHVELIAGRVSKPKLNSRLGLGNCVNESVELVEPQWTHKLSDEIVGVCVCVCGLTNCVQCNFQLNPFSEVGKGERRKRHNTSPNMYIRILFQHTSYVICVFWIYHFINTTEIYANPILKFTFSCECMPSLPFNTLSLYIYPLCVVWLHDERNLIAMHPTIMIKTTHTRTHQYIPKTHDARLTNYKNDTIATTTFKVI